MLEVDSFLVLKSLSSKEKPNSLSVSCKNVDTNFDPERQHPNFFYGNFSFATQNVDQPIQK
jgi:hypothetical protein